MLLWSYLLFVSGMSAIQATTNDQVEQLPLLIPILQISKELRIIAWLQHIMAPNQYTTFKAKLIVDCPHDEIGSMGVRPGRRSMTFGSYDYKNPSENRPSSKIKLGPREYPRFYPTGSSSAATTFCIKTMSNSNNFLARILDKFDNKMISIWWDTSLPVGHSSIDEQVVAEMALGGYNQERFVPSTGVTISVSSTAHDWSTVPWWTPIENLPVRVGDNTDDFGIPVRFDVTRVTSIPSNIYDAITKPLQLEVAYTLGLLRGMPQDTNSRIMQYAYEPITVFDCKDASKLLPLRIGPLTIPSNMMYKQISDEQCKIVLQKSRYEKSSSHVMVGFDVIRQFYLSIYYDPENGDSLEFSTRLDGEVPSQPVSPKTESSISGSSQSSSRNCCVS